MSLIYINPYTFAAPTSGIITDGLQLYLDAGNASSYTSPSLTWFDLSGNARHGVLTPTVGGPGFDSANGGSITFDKFNDYVQCPTSLPLTVTAATFIVWMKRGVFAGQYDGIFFSRGTNTTGLHFQSGSNLAYTWNDAANTYGWGSGLVIPQAWCMCALSVINTAATAYLYQASGRTSATNTVTHGSSVLDDLKLGRDDINNDAATDTRYYQGNIAQALLYNRALSEAELTANYNVDKARYGL